MHTYNECMSGKEKDKCTTDLLSTKIILCFQRRRDEEKEMRTWCRGPKTASTWKKHMWLLSWPIHNFLPFVCVSRRIKNMQKEKYSYHVHSKDKVPRKYANAHFKRCELFNSRWLKKKRSRHKVQNWQEVNISFTLAAEVLQLNLF